MYDRFNVDIDDIPKKNSYYRSINRFISKYGLKNAKRIIKFAYGYKYKGRFKGQIITDTIFLQRCDWMSDIILHEALASEGDNIEFKEL